MATRAIRRTPEEEHLAEQERVLAELTDELATREAEFAGLGGEFAHFRISYLRRFGPLYADLDRLDAEIARILADRLPDAHPEAVAARVRADAAEAQAQGSGAAALEAEGEPEPKATPSPDLKILFREVAKAVHPDLASDDDERARRTLLMAAASEAYSAGDEAALERILDAESARPEAVTGDDIGAQLVRVLRKSAQVRSRFEELVELNASLRADPVWQLFEAVGEASATGEDTLGALAAELDLKIHSSRAQLEALRTLGAESR